MPKEEFKEIKPANVEDDEDVVIRKARTPTTPNIDNEATSNTFFNNTRGAGGTGKGKSIFD